MTIFLALVLAALMGLAIQRGGTCTVAAVEEIVLKRRVAQLSAMVFAALWVAGLLALAGFAGFAMHPPPGYALSVFAIVGGALLGLGASLNGACAFGTVARLGAGQWAYVATPLGFALGAWLAQWLLPRYMPQALPAAAASPGQVLAWGLVLLALASALLRPGRKLAWSPASATLVIGLCFVLLMLTVGGAWTWSETVAAWARGMSMGLNSLSLLLVAALFAGSLFASMMADRFAPVPPSLPSLLRCLAGGTLMALGASLVPGSNDSLLLIGLPMFWPFAWVAFATMCVVIALATLVRRK